MMIQVKGLSKRVRNFSLKDITFSSDDGEFLVILGPSGAGKTMLLESIAGITKINAGRIIINGRDVTELPPEKRNIGFVYQDFVLFPHLTVRDNISFGLIMRNLKKEEISAKVSEIAELLDISHLLDRKPKKLSGGEKQRVALARALVIEPDVLLLDEPLSSLDVQVKKKLREYIRKVHDKYNLNTIYVTHDHIEAYTLADKIAIMNNGRLIEMGTPEKIFRNPSNAFTAEFVGFENIYRGTAKKINGSLLQISLNSITIHAVGNKEGPVIIAFRPDDIIVTKKPIESSARNTFEGKIVDIIDEDAFVKLKVDIGILVNVVITKKSLIDMSLSVGDLVFLSFKASAVKVF